MSSQGFMIAFESWSLLSMIGFHMCMMHLFVPCCKGVATVCENLRIVHCLCVCCTFVCVKCYVCVENLACVESHCVCGENFVCLKCSFVCVMSIVCLVRHVSCVECPAVCV
jgi:hypothetical protein